MIQESTEYGKRKWLRVYKLEPKLHIQIPAYLQCLFIVKSYKTLQASNLSSIKWDTKTLDLNGFLSRLYKAKYLAQSQVHKKQSLKF